MENIASGVSLAGNPKFLVALHSNYVRLFILLAHEEEGNVLKVTRAIDDS